MARDFYLNGESLVLVKGAQNTSIASLTQLGLADHAIGIFPEFKHRDLIVDAWGPDVPVDVQMFLTSARITMTLIHFDPVVLATCIEESLGGAISPGAPARAGTRMGGGLPRFAAGNHYIGLNIASPVQGTPWRFYYAYIEGSISFPLGTEKTVVTVTWRAIPYTQDPWNNGFGANIAGGPYGAIVYDNVLDT